MRTEVDCDFMPLLLECVTEMVGGQLTSMDILDGKQQYKPRSHALKPHNRALCGHNHALLDNFAFYMNIISACFIR